MENSFPNLDSVPVGFRFRPTDEELVDHYLKLKLRGNNSIVHRVIPEIDVCKVEPWEVRALSVIKSDDPEWFFFSPRDYKYVKSKRLNRTTPRGFWKATGNDRNIKIRGTDKIIGTKKTLVYHEGRVPNGVKSNWVIHEYHAVTFDESQRTYVLCHLKKNVEKKAAGESSRHIGSDYENQAPLEEIPDIGGTLPEVNLDSIFRSSIGVEQEVSFPNSPTASAYFRNENFCMETPFEYTEEEDEFINSMIIEEDFIINENTGHAFVNGPIQSETLRRVYYDSSDTDAEVASAMNGDFMDISTLHHEHRSSNAYQSSKLFKSSHGAVCGSIHLQSSDHDANRIKKESTFEDDFFGKVTSSCDPTVEVYPQLSHKRTSQLLRNKNHPRPTNTVSQRSAANRSQTPKKVSGNAVSHTKAEDESLDVRSGKIQNKAQNTSSRESLQTRSHHYSDVNRKGSFIYMETLPPSQRLLPLSVYLVNVVIGILLLIFISWDVLSC